MSVFRASNSPDTDWSVPVQRGPYPAGYLDQDGPTERLYLPTDEPEPLAEPDDPLPDEPSAAEPRRARPRGVAMAVLIALTALLVSGGAALIAWRALGRADTAARSAAGMHLPAPAPAPSALTTSSPPAATGPTASGADLRYAQEPVQLRAGCGERELLDLDGTPRVDAPEPDADLRYDNRCAAGGPLLSAGPGAQALSHVTDPDTDRPSCADAVRTDPLEDGDGVPVQKGTVVCVATATSLALVEITGVGQDGTADLRATGWTPVPAPSDSAASPAARGATPPGDDATAPTDGARPVDPDGDGAPPGGDEGDPVPGG